MKQSKWKNFVCLGSVMLIGWSSVTIQVEAGSVELEVAGAGAEEFRPYRGLTYTKEGIEEVREVARSTARGQAVAKEVFATAERWLEFSTEEIDALIPTPDAVFAIGFAGDPKSTKPWPRHARGDEMCSLDRPGEVRSPHTGDVYGTQKPGEKYYDDGSGWTRKEDGKTFYFVGIWNAWVVDTMLNAIDDMAIAYMLSGDERIAERALHMLDALATLRAKRPDDRGPVDWPSPREKLPADYGFLVYGGNGANGRMYQTLLALDLLGGSSYANVPSSGGDNITVFENIRENFVSSFETFYKEQLHTFYNHLIILYANEIAQGVLFGERELLEEGIDAVYGFLDNCINRDGEYFENAAGYNEVGVNYAAQMIVPLSNYDPKNYRNGEELPDPVDFPFEMQFGNDPGWISAAVLMQYRPIIFGRKIQYGDFYADRRVDATGLDKWMARRRAVYLRLLNQQTTDENWRGRFGHLFSELPEESREEIDLYHLRLLGMSQWFNPVGTKGGAGEAIADMPDGTESDMLGARGIGILRSGDGLNRRALFMRGGVNNVHGHDDQMGLILYARGMSLTGLYGYRFSGMPDHWGWGTRAISHKMVTVNQDLPARSPYKDGPAADILAFVPQEDGPESQSAQLMEMSGAKQWWGTEEYRRAVWQVDVSDDQFYFLDIFRVRGGKTHDYAWTGPYPRSGPAEKGFSISGVSPKPVEGVWTLAGFDKKYRNASFDAEGRSWGERLIISSGKVRDLKIPGEEVKNVSRWSPPPGNGYGFIWDVKSARTDGNWSARWNLLDGKSQMRLTMLNPDGQQVIVGKSPALNQGRHHAIVVARREAEGSSPLRSRFVSVTEVADGENWPVAEAVWITAETAGDPGDVAALELLLRDGRRDVVATTTGKDPVSAGGMDLRGGRGFVRFSAAGGVEEMLLQEGTAIRAGGILVQAAQDAWRGKVTAVESVDGRNRVKVDVDLPAALRTEGILFDGEIGSGYTHNEFYRIYDLAGGSGGSIVDLGPQSLVGARLTVTEINENGVVQTRWPNAVGGRPQAGYFNGKQIVGLTDFAPKGHVAKFTGARSLVVTDSKKVKAGDRLAVRMVQPGDVFSVPSRVALKRTGENEWRLRANQALRLTFPAERNRELVLQADSGGERVVGSSVGGRIVAELPLEWMENGAGTLRIVP